jgi:hypothetical protein
MLSGPCSIGNFMGHWAGDLNADLKLYKNLCLGVVPAEARSVQIERCFSAKFSKATPVDKFVFVC